MHAEDDDCDDDDDDDDDDDNVNFSSRVTKQKRKF